MGGRSPAFIDQHSIPAEPELYTIERFRDFLDARDVLLRRRYAEILGFGEAWLAETTTASEEENHVIKSKK
jgi:hypothetical protein